ncbi:MAG: DUF4105 domain-containing protein [Treponema sp.]|nr:DUF4105 domain-containing protein [Treponema sp.]MCL2272007.1 DUF4105 domain-containing protein [Treponema sp.]
MSRKFLLVIIFFLLSAVIYAQGENLVFKIAVIGPGDELYFWWGHIALIIEDTGTGQSRFYDYGLFSFDNENFFTNFAIGRLLYSCGSSPTERNVRVYESTNRSIKIYTLDILPEKKMEIKNFAERNVLPENRDYFYHHFKDNCSTRIRDIIDLITDGQFRRQTADTVSRFTLRDHVRRHTWFSPMVDWVLNFWMGQVIDTPITVWDDMFLPSEVGKCIEDYYYIDAEGNRRKLVASVEIILESHGRPGVLDTPRLQWPRQLIFSFLLSSVFLSFFILQAKNYYIGRVLAGISMGISGLIFGFAALLLYFLNIFTNHDYTYQNFNMIFATPLLLAAIPLGIYYAFTKNQDKFILYNFILRIIWFLTVLGVLISMILNMLPDIYQKNLTDQMLFLPISFVFAFHPAGLKEIFNKYLRKNKE